MAVDTLIEILIQKGYTMTQEEFLELLINALKQRGGFRQNNTEVVCYCPNCETHKSGSGAGHLYISMVKKGNPCHCKRCNLQMGSLTVPLLEKLSIRDPAIINYVQTNFRRVSHHFVNVNEKINRLSYKIPQLLKQDKFKIDYLNNRLPSPISSNEDLKKYRIVTSATKFMRDNDIKADTFTEKELRMFPLLDSSYIGFLSYFGNTANFRNVSSSRDIPRYITVPISKEMKQPFFYTPESSLDPLTDNPKITLAEGCIDIIAIHQNDSVYDENNNVYVATTSIGSYRNALKMTLGLTGFYGAHLNIYLDNDDGVTSVDKFDYSNIVQSLSGLGNSFKVTAILNLAGKDFGDVREKIVVAKKDITHLLK